MKLDSLTLFNLRSFEFAEIGFDPQFTLIAGVNGAGKSTVLDAIRTCASHLLPAMRRVPFKPFSFDLEDIRNGAPFADATLRFTLDGEQCRFSLREWREPLAYDKPENLDQLRREIMHMDRPGERPRTLMRELAETLVSAGPTLLWPSEMEVKALAALEQSAPLIVYFSTSRSRVSGRKAESSTAAKGEGAAYVRALGQTELSIPQFADWLRAHIALSGERDLSYRLTRIIEEAVQRFLPGFSNLRPSKVGPSQLLIDFEGNTLNLRQLSDGERSVLVLVLDIARRLAQANPNLGDPIEFGEAIILIDEIDLHLHPQWQRKIIGDLIKTFPSCQFIATTHSPQVIGEVPHGQVRFIDGDEITTPDHSFGVDSSRVLEELMDTKPRNAEIDAEIARIARLVGDGQREAATSAISALAEKIGENDPEITRALGLLAFMDEGDS